MQRHSPSPPQERGFTLLEILVAFVIAALALGVLYGGTLGGVVAVSVAARSTDATQRAQSHLAAVIHGGTLTRGEQSGDDGGGYHWRSLVRPMAASQAAVGVAQATLYAVTVWVSWQSGGRTREIRLDTEAVGPTQR